MHIDNDKLKEQSALLESQLHFFELYGRPLVDRYSKELDEKVTAIKTYLDQIRQFNLEFDVPSLQKIVIDLSSTIYFTQDRVEQLGLLEDIAKMKHKDKYNSSFLDHQAGATQDKRKFTNEQLRAIAESEAVEESLIVFIYSHAASILQSKIDAAQEVLRACSKSLSAEIQSMSTFSAKYQ